MKTLIIAAAAATLAAPAFADRIDSPLEARQHFAASESGNEAWVYVDANDGISREAARIFRQIALEDDSSNRGTVPSVNELVTKDRGVVNGTAARIFERLDAEDPSS